MTRKPVPDQAARDRIVNELDVNLIVDAGAGSGKTEQMSRRMAAGIASGAYRLDEMAAVTFTRKAAAELRGRFQLALERELQQDGPEDRRQRIRESLSRLERFFAGTIHSFCARLLRERPVEAGVSPGFTELDEIEEPLIRQRAWRDYRAQARAAGDPNLLALDEAGVSASALDNAFETVCLYEDVTFPAPLAPLPDVAGAWRALDTFWRELRSRLPGTIDAESKCKTQGRAQRFEREYRAVVRGRREPSLLCDLLQIWEPGPDVTGKWWADKRERQKRLADEVERLHDEFRTSTVQPYLTAWRQYAYAPCMALLVNAREVAKAERRRLNTLSFNDLLLLTAEVLRTNASVRRALQRKYRWLFVDEFQDTDPIQAEIMFLLAAEEDASNWRTVSLRPGALFVVGDPKQSIYRFRRADIDIYNYVRKRIGGPDGANVVHLTTNFRSVPGLCEWANEVFEQRFPKVATEQAPAFDPLVPDPNRKAAFGLHLAVIDIPATVKSGGVAAWEADQIARYIRGEVAAGRRKYGDFLILTRKRKGLRPSADALESLGVPIEVTGAGAFGDSEEVRELSLLLLSLADPQDAVALVGVLRGSLFGLSDRDLFAFRQADGYFSLFTEIETDAPGARRVADALAKLRSWHKWTRQLPAGAALERVLEDSGYLALAAAPRGGVEAGDLLHAVDRVRAVVSDGFTVAAAAEALAGWCGLEEDPTDDSSDVDSLPLEPGRSDVVRLMNLHKAKGLEAAVVFLADPNGGYESPADIRIVRDGAEALGYFRLVDKKDGSWRSDLIAEPLDWSVHEADEETYLQAELDRLFYVAATRAKDLLVVGRYLGKSGSNRAWPVFTSALGNAKALKIPAAVAPAAPPKVDLSTATASRAAAEIDTAHERSNQASWSTTSVTAELKSLPRAPVDGLDSSDPTQVVVPKTMSHRSDAGAAWGSLVHGLLEHAMRHRTATREDLRRLAQWLTVEEPQLRTVVEQAVDTAMAVAASDELATARATAECYEEVPFAARATDFAGVHVVTGSIDLVHGNQDAWRVVDYKTDVDRGAVDTKYAEQVRAYAEAWAGISRSKVTTSIVSARSS